MSHYLPVLLVSVSTNAIPDDSALTILPRGQVDYLSHNWREEDVWRSWRNMTRQKNEIANGMRLENASWRTWWKQRNKLKTVTPEQLNWFKDSDVTWLYGPLHTDVDWIPPPKPPPTSTVNSVNDRLDFNTAMKPILKHRSISELLTSDMPSSLLSPAESDNEEPTALYSPDVSIPARQRPILLHTKSDTYITRWGPNRAFRKDSPPRVPPLDVSCPSLPYSNSNPNLGSYFNANNSASGSTCSSVPSHGNLGPGSDNGRDTSPSSVIGAGNITKRKHISFNTFVQRCIAIEKPKKSSSFSQPWYGADIPDDDGYDEDEEDGYQDEQHWSGHPPVSDRGSDSDGEDEDDVLEICTPSSLKLKARSKSKASSSSSSVSPSAPRRRLSARRTLSSDREHVTIAPIAPTILKTTGAGDRHGWGDSFGDDYNYSDDNDGRWFPRERERTDSSEGTPVELVYVPPLGSHYQLEAEPEDLYSPHRTHFGGPEEVDEPDDTYVLPPGAAAAAASRAHTRARPAVVGGDREEFEDAYDYFGGPDFGEEFLRSRTGSTRRRDDGTQRGGGEGGLESVGNNANNTETRREILRFAHGGAASVTGGRNSGLAAELPEVVLNGRSGAVIDLAPSSEVQLPVPLRSRSGTRPRTRTPSPVEFPSLKVGPVPVPCRPDLRIASDMPSLPVPVQSGRERGHLHGRSVSYSPPSLPLPTRGRSELPKSASALGLESAGNEHVRGRSSTRSSPSISDRERERYVAGSPLGSLLPEGLGVGGFEGTRGHVHVGGKLERERERERRTNDRGRERTARKVGTSPNCEDVSDSDAGAKPRELSTSSEIINGEVRPAALNTLKDRMNGMDLTASDTFQQEINLHRSWNPTPVNSPVTDVFGKSPFSTTSSPVSPTTRTTATTITATPPATSSSPSQKMYTPRAAIPALRGAGKYTNSVEQHLENGTLVSRAVGIVSSAGMFLGLWQNGSS